MLRLLRRLNRAWRLARRPLVPVLFVPPWTEEDARGLREFLKSPAGMKLGTTLRHLRAERAFASCSAEVNALPWQCGHASGIGTVLAAIDEMAQWSAEPASKDDRPTDDLIWLHGSSS